MQKSNCIVLASIMFICKGSWWYPACKCNMKVYPADDMYFCENCVRHIVNPIPKFKLQLRVMDHTESTTFVVFDQEAASLLSRPCSAFVDASTKVCVHVFFSDQ